MEMIKLVIPTLIIRDFLLVYWSKYIELEKQLSYEAEDKVLKLLILF